MHMPIVVQSGGFLGRLQVFIKLFVDWGTTSLTISNKEMEDIMKIVKSFEQSGLLIKVVHEPIESEAKKQKGEFLNILLCTSVTSLLGNLLTG